MASGSEGDFMSLFDFFRFGRKETEQSEPITIYKRSYPKSGNFTAANVDRTTFSWSTQPLSADSVIDRNYRVLVARSREQASNNDYAKAFLRMCRQNIIGSTGIMLQSQVTDSTGRLDKEINDAIETAFWEWSKRQNCDVTGRQSLRSICNSCVTSLGRDGEFFVLKVRGKEAGPWGFSLQIVDPLRCPVDLNEDKLRNGNFIRHGIEFTRYGKPVAYYFTTLNSNADMYDYSYSLSPRNYIRKPADEVLHVFDPILTGQKRGLPWLATALYKMRHLNAFEEAALINARVSAAKMGFVQWKEGFGPEADDEIPEIYADPGVFETLPQGAELKEFNPQYPSGEFQPFVKHMLRGIAAGLGVPYNELASDLEGVNFSSIRQGTLDSREHWKDCQELIIENFMQPIFDAWLPTSLLSGRIRVNGIPLKAERIEKFSAVQWQARRWAWIDPRADVTASVTAKDNLLTSPGAIIRESGKDPQTVWSESARDMASMRDAYIAEGFSKEVAERLVLKAIGIEMPEMKEGEGSENQ